MSNTNFVGVNLAADVTAFHSYAESSRQIANALLAARISFVINDWKVSWFAARSQITHLEEFCQTLGRLVIYRSRNDPTMVPFVSQRNPYPINLVRLWPWVSQRFYASNPAYFREKKNVAMWSWEWSEFPEEWIPYFRRYDEIWTTSKFVREAFKSAPIPVRTQTPALTIDESTLNASFARQRFGLKKNTYLFLSAWNFSLGPGTFGFERKNPFAVLRAFSDAFSEADDAVLIVKAPPLAPALEPSFKNLKSYVVNCLRKNARAFRRHNVIILEDYLTRTDLMSLIASCDCFVSLHRAEGFGQMLAQAMYLEKPVIATGYSGNLDYMNNRNSYLVKHSLVPTGRFEEKILPVASEAYTWAEPDVDHASQLMRWVYEHREEARIVGKRASEHVHKLMNPSRVGEEIREKCANLMNG